MEMFSNSGEGGNEKGSINFIDIFGIIRRNLTQINFSLKTF